MGPSTWDTCFASSTGAPHSPLSPLCSFRHWLSMVTGPKKPETTPSSGSAPAPDTGPGCGILEMTCCLCWHLPTFTGFFCILKCTLSPQRYFPYLISNLSDLKLRLETTNFSCLGVMELEPLTSGVVLQGSRCKLGDGMHVLSCMNRARTRFAFSGQQKQPHSLLVFLPKDIPLLAGLQCRQYPRGTWC